MKLSPNHQSTAALNNRVSHNSKSASEALKTNTSELLAVSRRLPFLRGGEGLPQDHRNVSLVGVEAPTEHSDIA